MSVVKTVYLPPRDVPDESTWNPGLSAWFHLGANAEDAVQRMPAGLDVAIDIETPSVTDSFSIKCVTAAWDQEGRTHAVLLDPLRRRGHAELVLLICGRARWLILQNDPFDIPGLAAHGLMHIDHIAKTMDTLIFARSAWPDPLMKKGLEALAARVLGMRDFKDGLKLAQKASGLTSNEKWFRDGDIHMPVYRFGAIADTVVTLRLAFPMFDRAVDRQLDHPFARYGCTTREAAGELVMREQRVNRVMLRRAARGYRINPEYLDSYVTEVEKDLEIARAVLSDAGLRPGVGADVVNHLDAIGQLPPRWARTKTGRLKADKDAMERLPGHPLVEAHRKLADTEKIMGYMEKVVARSHATGRLHPQWQILGASASGRMSCTEPELQQFSELARPVIMCDESSRGLTSIDWSSIEPALLGWMSQDWEFIDPFEQGADIYEPVMKATGQTRKTSKTVLLAGMYGQARASLAARIGITEDEAAILQRQMRSAMPKGSRYMNRIKQIAEDHGVALTVSGRVLTIPSFQGQVASYKAVNYCVSPDTPILTADLRHVPAHSIEVGQQLVGFDEVSKDSRGRGSGKRFFRTAVVEAVSTVIKPSVAVYSADGRRTVCSADHLWLVRVPTASHNRLRWVRADKLTPEHQLMSLGVWEADDSRTAGYLAGLYDGEGSMSNRAAGQKVTILNFSQKPGITMDAFRKGMEHVGLECSYSPCAPASTSPCDNVRVHGLAKIMRTVGTLRPERFIARASEIFDGAELHTVRQMESCPQLLRVEHIGDRELTAIQTSTRTLVANGYLSHNCFQGSCADLIYEAIDEADRRGIGDHIMLPMHDEIVCDDEVSEEIQRIMSTPPRALIDRAGGRVPVIRTDREFLEQSWRVC